MSASRIEPQHLTAAIACSVAIAAVALAIAVTRGEAIGNQGAAATLLSSGMSEFTAGRTARARSLFAAASQVDPSSHRAWYDLGVVDALSGRHALARSEYGRALALAPDYSPALWNLGILTWRFGRKAHAAALLRSAISADPLLASRRTGLRGFDRLIGQHGGAR